MAIVTMSLNMRFLTAKVAVQQSIRLICESVSEYVPKLKFIFKRLTYHFRMTQDDSRMTPG